jgi:two-component system sensor histidine kinase YesM
MLCLQLMYSSYIFITYPSIWRCHLKIFKFHSLQSKITATFLVFIVTQLLIYSAVTYWFDSRSIYNEVANANLLTVEQMTNVLDTQIITMDNVSLMLAENSIVRNVLIESQKIPITKDISLSDIENSIYAQMLIQSTLNSWSQFDNIYLYDLQGRKMGVMEYEVVVANPDLNNFKNTDTQIVYGTVLNKPGENAFAVFSYLRLVKDADGLPLGWIRMDLNLYNHVFFQKLYADDRIFMVLEPNARVIYANHPEKTDIVMISELLRNPSQKNNLFAEYLGKLNLISYNTSSVTQWMTILTVPQEVLNNGLKKVRTFAVSFILVNVVLAVFGAILISRRVTGPLRLIFQSMKKIEMGDFNTQIPVVSKDEIGELARRMNKMAENIDLLIKKVYKADFKNQEARFIALRAQINPHFLYNTLESMDALALKEETWKLHQMIESLAIMLRYALHAKEYVMLKDEMKHLEAYLNIQKIKYADHLKIMIQISDRDYFVRMPQLILQPIVENSFKYGLFHKNHKNVLSLYTERGPSTLRIHIIDNGVGTEVERLTAILNPLDENKQLSSDKIGLYNVHHRIKLIFGDQYGVELKSKLGYWFKVTITIPIEEEGNSN